jgi:2-keto-4-pentenoate hydratase/2-oxohepta-3-ene-1,7-dioic acid hydratase in catechol pathway
MKIIRYADAEGKIGYAAQENTSAAKAGQRTSPIGTAETVPLRNMTEQGAAEAVPLRKATEEGDKRMAQGAGGYLRIAGDIFGEFAVTREPAHVERLLAPVAPPMIWGVGLNYRRHAAEANMAVPADPVIFVKGVNSIQHPDGPIVLPAHAPDEVDYECELVVIIGKACHDVRREEALQYVLGYTCGNDVSARDWQLRLGGSQWCRGKSFDTFAPIGPCIATREELPDPNAVTIRTRLNGTVVQESHTSDMIFDVPTLVAFLSQDTTLLPGTLIFTGTPQGVGMGRKPPRWLHAGDEVTIEIEGIGTLTNRVSSAAQANGRGSRLAAQVLPQ